MDPFWYARNIWSKKGALVSSHLGVSERRKQESTYRRSLRLVLTAHISIFLSNHIINFIYQAIVVFIFPNLTTSTSYFSDDIHTCSMALQALSRDTYQPACKRCCRYTYCYIQHPRFFVFNVGIFISNNGLLIIS